MLYPRGPRPIWVYWARRLVILLVIGVIVGGIGWVVMHRAAPASPASNAAVVEPSSGSSGEAVSSGEPIEPTGAPVDCIDSAMLVEVATGAKRYTLGDTPKITLSVTNVGAIGCLRDVGPKANSVEITSGGYHIWSSNDCTPDDTADITMLDPGERVDSVFTWDGMETQKGCPEPGTEVKVGRYEVIGENKTVKSEAVKFRMRTG